MNKSNPTKPKYLLMLLAAGGLMFNVACTADGIDGLPGGFGSGQDDATVNDKEEEKKDVVKKDDGLYVPGDGEIWQGENSITQKEED